MTVLNPALAADLSLELSLDQSLERLCERIRAWTSGPGFTPVTVPELYHSLSGSWEGRPFRLETHRFSHARLRHLTWARLSEGEACRAITLYALPTADNALPILGLDYVGLGGMLTLAALDLAPVGRACWSQQAAPLLEGFHADDEGLILRRMPAFAQTVFSERALLAAAKSAVGWNRALAHALTLITSYAAWLDEALVPAPEADEEDRVANWCRAMAGNKKESGALSRMFGPLAEAYLQDYLFALRPEPEPPALQTGM